MLVNNVIVDKNEVLVLMVLLYNKDYFYKVVKEFFSVLFFKF